MIAFESESRAARFAGRGSDGDEEYSNAGNNDGAGAERLTPATGGGTVPVILRGEVLFMSLNGEFIRPRS